MYLQKHQQCEEVSGQDEGDHLTKAEALDGGQWGHLVKGPGGDENIQIPNSQIW